MFETLAVRTGRPPIPVQGVRCLTIFTMDRKAEFWNGGTEYTKVAQRTPAAC